MGEVAQEIISRPAAKLELRSLLFMQLRSPEMAENTELAALARDKKPEKEPEKREREDVNTIGKQGEFRTVPFTITNVEGIGRVDYGTFSFIVSSANVKAEKRPIFGEKMSGFATFSD